MASELIVQTIQGPSSGANANKVLIPSGHTLHAAGHVVQVVDGTLAAFATTNTSFVATGLYVNITPTSTSSKIHIDVIMGGLYFYQSGYTFELRRNGTSLGSLYGYGNTAANTGYTRRNAAAFWVDTPSTTSQITYELYIRSASGGAVELANSASFSNIRAMEIAQ